MLLIFKVRRWVVKNTAGVLDCHAPVLIWHFTCTYQAIITKAYAIEMSHVELNNRDDFKTWC